MVGNSQFSSTQATEWVKGKAIGSGSFGTVHLAMNNATGALFVVKTAQSEAGLQFLENEANIVENSNSPYVVQCLGKEDVLNCANGERKINLFMEYMCGGSLSDVAEKFGGALDERVISLYTREILLGLKYLHENGIVHCDLKCKNVLLGSSGNIKLADFGCAKKLLNHDMIKTNGKSMESCKVMGGTPLWMAPEVLRNEGLDFAADIWSLGCTVIEMATGRAPWGDDKVSNPMAAVLMIACGNEIPEFPAQFSKEGLDFLEKCLERNPKRRWTTEELLDHPFVTGKSGDGNSIKEDACSPASVLDVGSYDGSYESDESPDGGKTESRIPFSMKWCGERKRMPRRQLTDTDFESSENWVTVRSS